VESGLAGLGGYGEKLTFVLSTSIGGNASNIAFIVAKIFFHAKYDRQFLLITFIGRGGMGVPDRFAIEYPTRALELIGMLEAPARENNLLGSFGLLAASAILTIPFERMRTSHFLHNDVFLKAPFWRATPNGGAWRQSRIVNTVDEVHGWLDQDGRDPRSKEANTIQTRKASEVLRVLRNALAHGNIIYLDENGQEIAGNQMVYMAFLSRYEETAAQREQAETYRVLITTEEAFLQFVKSWAEWIGSLDLDRRLAAAA
jgi:hypothetical protein